MNYKMRYVRGDKYNPDVVIFPGSETPDSKVVQWNKHSNVMVFKTPGHSYWASRGKQGYMPSEYHVVQVDSVEDENFNDFEYQTITATGIACFPVRS